MRAITPFLLKIGLYHPLRRLYFKARNRGASAEAVFTEIYTENRWGNAESRSGEGSSLRQTEVLRESLPELFSRFGVKSLLDIPCGDFHWMSKLPLNEIDYVGADIVGSIIASNSDRYAGDRRRFIVADLCKDRLPKVDMIFCRDCMVHLPFEMLADAVKNIKTSGSSLLMATTFSGVSANRDIELGDFRPINLQIPPFNFPEPLELLDEHCTEASGAHADKMMGIWRILDLPHVQLPHR